MPYQLRHVDETLIADGSGHLTPCSVTDMLRSKLRLFSTNTRLFKLSVVMQGAAVVFATVLYSEFEFVAVGLLLLSTGTTICVTLNAPRVARAEEWLSSARRNGRAKAEGPIGAESFPYVNYG